MSKNGIIPPGTVNRELPNSDLISVHCLSSEQIQAGWLATMNQIKQAAWSDRFGTDAVVGEDTADIKNHLRGRNGSYQLAFDRVETPIGWIKHRPIYSAVGKVAARATAGLVKPTPERAYIHNVDVVPEEQRRGVGSALLACALNHYPNEAEVVTEAVGKYGYAHEWFEELGLTANHDLNLDDLNIGGVILPQTRYDSAAVGDVLANLQH